MKKLTLLFLSIIPFILLATAAGKRSARAKQHPAPQAPATGTAPKPFHIEGETFRLPAGITLTAGSMKGHNAQACSCDAAPQAQRLGDGCLVRLRFRLRNHTAAAVRVTLPAGLVFQNRYDHSNDALLARPVELNIPASATAGFHLDLFGLYQSIPKAGPEGPYRFGPVSGNYDLQALLMTLEGKSLADVHSLAVAQEAIWEVTNGHIPSAGLAGKVAQLP
ncbi:hypothetical protein WJU16_24025 [Chitinophaga pollutisoli]|uniref:DUF4384 domain-containing protein n=1 Tax=Chitinophaga pollutisoli TaxID=3133966 RepID=A0ABZ2YMN7_9BACT